jgi:hypothetical protein
VASALLLAPACPGGCASARGPALGAAPPTPTTVPPRHPHIAAAALPRPQTGLEPRKLFNVVEFMMHDKDSSGTIDMDECMEILFRRFGKDELEERTKAFFQHDTDGDNAISFAEFQKQMQSIRPKRRDAKTFGTKSTTSTTSITSISSGKARPGGR